jgi:transglutaminase-like putative cysteine protease
MEQMIMPDSAISLPDRQQTIRPIAACALQGIAVREQCLWAIDNRHGYLLQIDPITENTQILNPNNWSDFVGAKGLAITEDTFWFTVKENIYFCYLNDEQFKTELFVRLPYAADGIAVWEATIYITCQKTGQILIYNRNTRQKITHFYTPGIGQENITVKEEEIWLTDTIEQTVYCLDRATGKTIFHILTPFESPTGLTFYTDSATGQETLYVTYADREVYIRDNPNIEPNYELQYRDRTFIHPLNFSYHRERNYTLSNGYLVEMSYVEELAPLDPFKLEDVEWRIALPAETDRQKIRHIEPIGLSFCIEVENGQKVAVFKFPTLTENDRHIFGWKAILEVWSIKYQIKPRDCENLPELPPEIAEKYLVDNDNLAMDTSIIRRAGEDAIGRETNLLRQVYSIRNYVYDKLSYGIKPQIDTPDLVLQRGIGSCGEYLGVLLALCRLNGIACRTVGRYKCPTQPQYKNVPLSPDYNHVWMEFYLPGFGWLPMESNPDDMIEGGPYPTRFFMGLAWYHAEMAKDVPFAVLKSQGKKVEKEQISIGDLAINHVRFKVLEEMGR